LAGNPDVDVRLDGAATSAHRRIREALSKAYFSYPHDVLGKFEFLAGPNPLFEDMAKLSIRFSLQRGADGARLRLQNVAPQAQVTADSTFPSKYGPGYYEPRFAADGKEGTPAKGIWVSAETAGAHFLELAFAKPVNVRGVVVTWAHDEAHSWIPQEFRIQVGDGNQWRDVLDAKENTDPTAVAKLEPPARVEKVKIAITRGAPSRPRLAAINEVQVLAIKE